MATKYRYPSHDTVFKTANDYGTAEGARKRNQGGGHLGGEIGSTTGGSSAQHAAMGQIGKHMEAAKQHGESGQFFGAIKSGGEHSQKLADAHHQAAEKHHDAARSIMMGQPGWAKKSKEAISHSGSLNSFH